MKGLHISAVFSVVTALALALVTPPAGHAADPRLENALQRGWIARYESEYVFTLKGFRSMSESEQTATVDGWRMFMLALGVACTTATTNAETVAALKYGRAFADTDALPDALLRLHRRNGCQGALRPSAPAPPGFDEKPLPPSAPATPNWKGSA